LVVVPIDEEHAGLMGYLTERPDATWGYIYFDGKGVVIADAAWPETADLLHRAAAGQLTYPDRASALLSRAIAMTARTLKSEPADVLQAFLAAVQAKPLTTAYDAVRQVSRYVPDPTSWQKTYFQEEYARLERMDELQSDGMRILRMRGKLAEYLADLYAADRIEAVHSGRSDAVMRASTEEARWKRTQEETRAALRALEKKWP
jgi:hypothetical protein